jgi:hypothetical protein
MGVTWPGIPHWPDEPSSEVYGFVPPGADIDLSGAAESLRRALPGVSIEVHRSAGVVNVVAAFADDWMVRVYRKEGVRGDALEMVRGGFLRDHPNATEIITCDRLVDVMIADPQVSVTAFEALEAARGWLLSQAGVIVVHPDTGEPP